MVVYVVDQSTDRPRVRQSSSNFCSSSTTSRSHSSTKFWRLMGISCFPGFSGGTNPGSYGSEGSHRTP
jgi:hypothetical protein